MTNVNYTFLFKPWGILEFQSAVKIHILYYFNMIICYTKIIINNLIEHCFIHKIELLWGQAQILFFCYHFSFSVVVLAANKAEFKVA